MGKKTLKVSKTGYKANSKDRNEPALQIPSNHITMANVHHPVFGIDDKGTQMMMMPGKDYHFPGKSVMEIPIKKSGGSIPLSDKQIEDQNKKYFIQRVNEVGVDKAIAEYKKHFNGRKSKYSIKK